VKDHRLQEDLDLPKQCRSAIETAGDLSSTHQGGKTQPENGSRRSKGNHQSDLTSSGVTEQRRLPETQGPEDPTETSDDLDSVLETTSREPLARSLSPLIPSFLF